MLFRSVSQSRYTEHTHTYTHIHTHTHTYTHIHTHTHTYTHIHTHTHTYTYPHIHYTHSLIHVHTLSFSYTHIHTYTHTRLLTNANTHNTLFLTLLATNHFSLVCLFFYPHNCFIHSSSFSFHPIFVSLHSSSLFLSFCFLFILFNISSL